MHRRSKHAAHVLGAIVAVAGLAAVLTAVPLLERAAAAPVPLPKMRSSLFAEPVINCGCHAQYTSDWQLSMHSKALADPLFVTKVGEADKATHGALGAFCNSCHSPVAVMAGEVKGTNQSKVSAVGKAGVSCDFCHHVSGGKTTDPGNYSFKVTADGVKKGPLKDAKAPHRWAYNAFFESAAFCGSCHNVNHPANGLHLESTYTEWKNGPYAKAGIRCQDCHMTPGPGVTEPNPGAVGGGGKQRKNVFTMTFAGGNVGLGDAARAEERLKAAAQLAVDAPEVVKAGTDVTVTCTITNVGAGHYLPTGLTDVRQMWLDLKVIGPDGVEIASVRRDFGTQFKDAKGKGPAEIWDATGVLKDDRIPPKKSVTQPIKLSMPDAGPVKVIATLNYRSASEAFAKKAGVTLPTTQMATLQRAVYTTTNEQANAERAAGPKPDSQITGLVFPLVVAGLVVVFLLGMGLWYISQARRPS